jgi:predicted SnoaL-like aldol condensation-catalyzing enzyme
LLATAHVASKLAPTTAMTPRRPIGTDNDGKEVPMHDGPLTRIATSFLRDCCEGRVGEAYERHVASDFRHHNPWFPGDAAALRQGMAQNAAQFPHKSIRFVRTVEDGNTVAVLSHVRHVPGDAGFGTAHFFRFDGERIAELWDIAQAVPEAMVNECGMF